MAGGWHAGWLGAGHRRADYASVVIDCARGSPPRPDAPPKCTLPHHVGQAQIQNVFLNIHIYGVSIAVNTHSHTDIWISFFASQAYQTHQRKL